MKAIVLLSGGLDSRLAVRLLQMQNIELEAVNFSTIFCAYTSGDKDCPEAASAAAEYGVPLKVYNTTEEIMELVKKPKFGYGRAMNPCIDCRIAMFRKAKKHMLASSASFIVTGEVLGERPMSQRKDAIKRIEKESGLEGLILRPLSAKLLEPTIPEKKGWVRREKLLDIKGRSRKPQIKLAEELGVKDYPTPAGGCLLTEPGFSKKVQDLIDHGQWDLENAVLLKYGRHFRISPMCKAIAGRDKEENERIGNLRKREDLFFEIKSHPGPAAVLKGKPADSEEEITARLAAYFVTKRKKNDKITVEVTRDGRKKILQVLPLNKEEVSSYRITA